MIMGVQKKVLSIRLDENMIEALRVSAEQQNRSLSNLIETILKVYIDKEKAGE